jgi:hypothetical protein
MTNTEQGQAPLVVLMVIGFIGTAACGGLAGLIFLIHSGTDATALLAVSNPTMAAFGILGAMLVNTRTSPPTNVQQAYTQGTQDTVAAVQELATPPTVGTVVVNGGDVPPENDASSGV